MTLLIFFAVLAVLVLVHEFGHFITAKRNGVGAEEFGFGFPPRLFGVYKNKDGRWQIVWGNKEVKEEVKARDETIYSFNLLPLGGFVKITGEDGEDKTEDGDLDEKSFANKSIWVRFKILVAGVTMNIFLAIFLFSLAFWIGLPVPLSDDDVNSGVPITITSVVPGSPADKAGLVLGDKILGMAHSTVDMKTNISINELVKFIEDNKEKKIYLKIQHPQTERVEKIEVTPQIDDEDGKGVIGVGLAKMKVERHSIVQAVALGLKATWGVLVMIFKFLTSLIIAIFTEKSVNGEVTGPIGIAKMSGEVAKMGWALLFQFVAMLSVNLAVVNLLPFPGLDGGRIIFLVIEKIKGSPVNKKVENAVNMIGFSLLLLLMFWVTIKDVMRFW